MGFPPADQEFIDLGIKKFRNWGIQGLINKIDRKHSIPKFAIPKSLFLNPQFLN